MNKKKQYPGNYLTWAIALLVLPIWWISYPQTTVKHSFIAFHVYASQITSLLGFSLFALSFVLATRFNILENLFGGMDKVYHAHHTTAKVALLCMFAHPLLLALRWVPFYNSKALWFLFPVHRRMEINFGSLALWGVVVLMFFTLVVKPRYNMWKNMHKLLGVFFIAALVHIYCTDPTFLGNPVLKIYILSLSLFGIIAWLYKSVLFDLIKKKFNYQVIRINHMNEKVMEIELSPLHGRISIIPGQFCFFSFLDPGITKESHPYTIIQEKENGDMTILVKSLGDYTKKLYEKLQQGATGLIEGPFGKFCYKNGSKNQLWIAGGVGIAPFISWANDLIKHPLNDLNVEIFYCVHHPSEATHIAVFMELQKKMPSVRIHLTSRNELGFIKMNDVNDMVMKELFICGPKEMRKTLLSICKKKGISRNNIHYEDFDFV